MITTPKQENQTADLYYNSEFVATIDYVQFLKIRGEIMEQRLDGYRVKHPTEDRFININNKGRLEEHPPGLFDEIQKLMYQLVCLKENK